MRGHIVDWTRLARFGVGFAIGLPSLGCFQPSAEGDDGGSSDSSGSGGTAGSGPSTSAGTMPSGGGSTDPSTTASTTDPTDTATATSVDDSSSTGGIELLECVEALVRPATGQAVVTIDTNPLADDFSGSCGGLQGNDIAYQWMAPFSDYFVFDTEGSNFDTVLYLRDDGCEGRELGCNNDAAGGSHSQVVAPLEAGDRVVIVVDGAPGEAGQAVVNVEAVACPSSDLNGAALPAEFSTVGGPNVHDGACGGGNEPERSFRYTAEEAGLYSFRATSNDFDPVMYAQAGPICGSPDLQCNATGGLVGAEVIRSLGAGESVTLVVDSSGGAGTFEIDVTTLGLTCPAENLDTLGGQFSAVDVMVFEHAMTTSCGPAGDSIAGPTQAPAATFSWTSPGLGVLGCNIFLSSGFPASFSLQEGTCDGPEVQCSASEPDGNGRHSAGPLSIDQIPETEFTITVQPSTMNGLVWADGGFELFVGCFIQ